MTKERFELAYCNYDWWKINKHFKEQLKDDSKKVKEEIRKKRENDERKKRYICNDCYDGKKFDSKLCNKSMYFNHCYCKKFLVEELGEKMEDVMND